MPFFILCVSLRLEEITFSRAFLRHFQQLEEIEENIHEERSFLPRSYITKNALYGPLLISLYTSFSVYIYIPCGLWN